MPSNPSARSWLSTALLRGVALFAAAFLLAGLAAPLREASLDTSHWLVDLRWLPLAPRVALLGAAAGGAALWGLRGGRSQASRRVAVVALGVLAVAGSVDVARVVAAAGTAGVALGAPPLSLAVAAVFATSAWRARRPAPAPVGLVVAGAGGVAVAFALALMMCFGTTDYRRPADAVVVLGARAYGDGRASLPLADRVRTGAQLVRDGLAPLLVVSGGPGDGAFHETDVMRRVAIEEGVPAAAVIADRDGLSTRHTARNVSRLLRERGATRALVVSNGYHLPRVKAAFDAERFRVFTVPAAESRTMWKMPWYVAREAAAWWAYWMSDRLA